ncbi:Dipeptide ABC transporter, permease protein DppC (TC 3.A.1.5.2) [Olavius algarvensis associated proteobacterium Delta 3]|nr:Dipeptide ABC transporter, permease protein DppC (TC 3.A.1.5.2) [Olavius algarvensis associated proteobacterium Delta 3]CAB5128429.1 Dipeptide ABC transporter, permease protein DppC (TC 3.A.1.5.2) [Olavius algarvensis associated proteobacterium Delta 3]
MTTSVTEMRTTGFGPALWRALKSFGLLRESWVGMVGVFLVVFWVLVAIFAPLLAPFDPNASIQPFAGLGAVSAKGGTFWLGTDHIGRDILSRIIWGSRTVLIYAPLATFSAYFVGILMGLAAGYRGGWVDDVLSRIADIILSFPVLVLYIIIIATIGASGFNIIIAITFASSPGIMRIVRGLVLDLRNRDYVAAAQTRGESDWRVMLVEILPNARGPLIVDACLRLGYVIITIGVLGFLGLGLPPPDPDWGGMVNETRQMAMAFPHMTLFPCIAISTLILGFNLLADGLREISLRD